VIIGSRSFGKGLVQRPVDLTYGTQLKVTISRYYTPSGRCIQALDYAHKDKNGIATKREEKNYTAFKTKKGRTVFDGGGILPDIALEETKLSAITEALEKNDAIFNFATQYYYKNPNLGNTIPTISEADYQDFKRFIKSSKFSFDTQTELALKNTLAAAKKEQIDEAITIEYQQLLAALQKSESALLDKNQKEIKNLIQEELIKRYQYQDGLYQFYLKNNLEIKRAVQVLNTPAEYKTLLRM
jgi:carboxyl-terminal processing protease